MKQKVLICQWCFEEPVMKGKMICKTCLDSAKRQMEENKDFDLDKWLEGDKVMATLIHFGKEDDLTDEDCDSLGIGIGHKNDIPEDTFEGMGIGIGHRDDKEQKL